MNKIYPIILVALLILGAKQGQRLSALQDSESFYRWIITTSALTRIGDTLEPDAGITDSMDDEVFALLDPLAETLLEDYEVDPELDLTKGQPNSRLLRAVRRGDDEAIWRIAQSAELQELKGDYLEYKAQYRIQSAGILGDISEILHGNSVQSKAIVDVQGVSLTTMFFGMRTLAANFLWLKVDTFWHAGEIHRMIPLMHTCVTLDPQFVDAFLLGSWHLSYNITANMPETPEVMKTYSEKYKRRIGDKDLFYYSAAEFLKDGIRKNPRDYRLYFDLGYAVYEQKLEDHVNAIRYLDEAIRHKHDRWVPRMLYRSLMFNGQFEDAIAGWTNYLTKFKNHEVGLRFLEINTARLHDAVADEALECKKLALTAQDEFLKQAQTLRDSDPQQAATLETQAQQAAEFAQEMEARYKIEFSAALMIWSKLYKSDSADTLAFGRLGRLRAVELRKQGRYLESIAELDIIRWQDLQFFPEASDLIMEIKEEADIPFTLSEQMELLRRDDLAAMQLEDLDTAPSIQRIECIYRKN